MDTTCVPLRQLALALVMALVAFPQPSLAGTSFKPPVQVTPYPGKGYEPGIVVDRFGNIFAAAHKENWQLVVAPDTNCREHAVCERWFLHKFRANFATELLQGRNGDLPFSIEDVRYLMGHKDLESIQRYVACLKSGVLKDRITARYSSEPADSTT